MPKYKTEMKNFVNKHQKKYKCFCGCEKYIKIKLQHYYEGVPKFILGHYSKGNNNPNIDKWIKKNQNKHLCTCGCGQHIKILRQHHWQGIPQYITGHGSSGKSNKGKKNGMYGYNFSKKQRKQQGRFHKNKTYEEIYGKEQAKEIKIKMKLAQQKRYLDPKERLKGRNFGANNGMWQNGISKLPYTYNFNKIAEQIRKRDKYRCQICNKKQNKRALSVHHINYNKQDNREINLITLCIVCHNSTNGNRDYWFAYFCYLKNLEPISLF